MNANDEFQPASRREKTHRRESKESGTSCAALPEPKRCIRTKDTYTAKSVKIYAMVGVGYPKEARQRAAATTQLTVPIPKCGPW